MIIGTLELPAQTTIQVGSHGSLEIVGSDWIHIATPNSQSASIHASDLLKIHDTLSYAFNDVDAIGLLVAHTGDDVFLLDMLNARLTVLAHLHRDSLHNERQYNPGGLHRMALIACEPDVLIVYEGGILSVAMQPPIHMRWRHDHHYLDWLFTGVSAGVAWYESDHDGTWGISVGRWIIGSTVAGDAAVDRQCGGWHVVKDQGPPA